MLSLLLVDLPTFLSQVPIIVGLIVATVGLAWVILSRRLAANSSYADYKDVSSDSKALIIHRVVGFLFIILGCTLIILSCVEII